MMKLFTTLSILTCLLIHISLFSNEVFDESQPENIIQQFKQQPEFNNLFEKISDENKKEFNTLIVDLFSLVDKACDYCSANVKGNFFIDRYKQIMNIETMNISLEIGLQNADPALDTQLQNSYTYEEIEKALQSFQHTLTLEQISEWKSFVNNFSAFFYNLKIDLKNIIHKHEYLLKALNDELAPENQSFNVAIKTNAPFHFITD